MKRLFLLLLCLFMLTGCTSNPPETTAPAATEGPTEPPIPWIEELGTPWDEEGALVEVPLTIPNGLHYANSAGFDGDLLLWSVDDHRGTVRTLELCLLELDTGAVTAQRELDFKGFVSPQILEDKLFLCDSQSGTVLELNNRLEIVSSWNAEPIDGSFYMGAEDTLYIHQWDGGITVQNLNTGEKKSLLDEETYIDYFSLSGNVASVEYFEPVTGTKKTVELKPFETLVPEGGQVTDRVEYLTEEWFEKGVASQTPVFDRYEDMMRAFAQMAAGEKENPYTYDYELELYRTILKSCGA